MQNKHRKQLFLICDCNSDAALFDWDDADKELNLAIFARGLTHKPKTWREKARWIWHIIKSDEIWNDEVILNKDKVKKLKNFINTLN